jgi:tRNA A37 threonylcarbamoyladenosine dehydratase
MGDWLMREKMLIGEEAAKRLSGATVAVVGLGGVGGGAAEALCRAGVGQLIFVDHDQIDITNLNRQIVATSQNIGKSKAQEMKKRALAINPAAEVLALELFYDEDRREELFSRRIDYIIDAIDSVAAKTDLIVTAKARGVPIISAMGTGNKLDPSCLTICDIYKTSMCPLAKEMRRRLRAAGVGRHTVIFSPEEPKKVPPVEKDGYIAHPPGTVSWVPPVAGMMMAGYALRDLLGILE